MKRHTFLAALALAAAAPLPAQRAPAFEVGVFGQYIKFDDFTKLDNAAGLGARAGVYFMRRLALEYEADFAQTKSSKVGNLTDINNRIDLVYYHPLGEKLRLLIGGGFTGTKYNSDTTKNEFDSGGNAMAGLKYCMSENWAWRADAVADFKDPSDQTLTGERTTTYSFRLGFSRFFGGPAKYSPCYIAPPPPPPPPAPAPAPAPPPPPPPPPPASAPAPPPPPPPPAPAPAKPREIFTLHDVHFAFDKSLLTKDAKDTLNVAVRYLKEHGDMKVEVQGHTDSIGTEAYNQGLSERRANAVKTYLASQGIAADRIAIKGFGETKPVADNGTKEGRAMNRRAVVIEVP